MPFCLGWGFSLFRPRMKYEVENLEGATIETSLSLSKHARSCQDFGKGSESGDS